MALAAIHVKKPREAQIWNCCTGNPVLRILPDSNMTLAVTKVFTKRRESHLTPFDVSAHIKWCERSYQMV